MKEIRLNKKQFKIFNDDDQFQLFCDDEGMPDFEDFNEEVEKLFNKFDHIIVTEKEQIIGVKNGKREELSDQAYEGYGIALEIQQDFK
ncbi:MAG: hypothetical protein U9P79_08400 [Candidatus Cloacimonadota bacterium]|nr:hypothetical protein [Candidatus Cloacimonadota bacterium]